MRYLVEVQKQSKGFMGGFETKLKLLACQRNDRSWSVVQGNEFINTEDIGNLGDGALAIVEITNRQVQGKLETASKEILGILQGFSRLLEKVKSQEDEIEGWKESLTIQSEELSRRELEMETRLEQLERMEEEFNKFDEQRQEVLTAQQEAEKIKKEFETKTQELTQAWEHLKGEQQLLEQKIQDSKLIDESQAAEVLALLNSLSLDTASTDSIQNKLRLAFQAIEQQQEFLTRHWQELEQNQKNIQKYQQDSLHNESEFEQCQRDLESLNTSIIGMNQQLQTAQKFLETKQELFDILENQERANTELKESFARIGIESSGNILDQSLDLNALENVPLPELELIVQNLQKDLEKVARFVSDQEEELSWQCKAVEELEAKINKANEFDRLSLEQELAEEKEAKNMLDETLVGQRRSLKERHEFLLQHSRILKRRQGIVDLDGELETINLDPIKYRLEEHQTALQQQQEIVQKELEQIQANINQLSNDIQQEQGKKAVLQEKLIQKQNICQESKTKLIQAQAQLKFYQENLQPLQNILNDLRQSIEGIENLIVADSTTEQSQTEVLVEIDRIIKDLVGTSTMRV